MFRQTSANISDVSAKIDDVSEIIGDDTQITLKKYLQKVVRDMFRPFFGYLCRKISEKSQNIADDRRSMGKNAAKMRQTHGSHVTYYHQNKKDQKNAIVFYSIKARRPVQFFYMLLKLVSCKEEIFLYHSLLSHNFNSSVSHFSFNYKDDNSTVMI